MAEPTLEARLRELLPCDGKCKPLAPMMSSEPSPIVHTHKCIARYHAGLLALVEAEIAKAADPTLAENPMTERAGTTRPPAIRKPRTEPCPHCDGVGTRLVYPSGRYLRDARLRAQVSLREMARRIGLSPTMLCDLELGRRQLTRAQWDAVARSLR